MLFSLLSGRNTELCSRDDITACPPLWRILFIAIFSAWVALSVKMIFSGDFSVLKSFAIRRLHSYSADAAYIDGACPPLPGLPHFLRASAAARCTFLGLINVVAALSRYIIFRTSYYLYSAIQTYKLRRSLIILFLLFQYPYSLP